MSQRMGGCEAAWQAVRGAPKSREHVVTETRGVREGMKALTPHSSAALEELALLSDVRRKDVEG